MPRRADRSKPRIYRDMCLALDVVTLARAGWLTPGHHAGDAELLAADDTPWRPSVPIRTLIGASGGSLHVETPREETIPLERVETSIGPTWRLVCKPCGRPVRRLYLPETPPGVETPWACRRCWGIAYRDARPGESAREQLARLIILRSELANLERIIRTGANISPQRHD